MPRPSSKDQYIFCPSCHLGDYWIVWNEASGQSAVVCQNCGAAFIRIEYVPSAPPDPAVVI